jgi:hypothetical protein
MLEDEAKLPDIGSFLAFEFVDVFEVDAAVEVEESGA